MAGPRPPSVPARHLFHHDQCHLVIQMTFPLFRLPEESCWRVTQGHFTVEKEEGPRHPFNLTRVFAQFFGVFECELCFSPKREKKPDTYLEMEHFRPVPLSFSKNKPTKNCFHFIQDSVNVSHAAGLLVAETVPRPPPLESTRAGNSEKFKDLV